MDKQDERPLSAIRALLPPASNPNHCRAAHQSNLVHLVHPCKFHDLAKLGTRENAGVRPQPDARDGKPRLRFWENRLKLPLTASLIYAFLRSLLTPRNAKAAPPSGDAALQIARRLSSLRLTHPPSFSYLTPDLDGSCFCV